jgi:Peptidase propeptide and YPEB domain
MLRTRLYIGALALAASVPQLALAQQATASSPQKVDPVLAAEAKISLDSARTIALHRVRNGQVAAEELEREHGRLIYSFDVKVPGKSGIQEVNVNALTGAVVDVHHESAATEAREARDDSAAAKKAAAARAKPPV